MYEFLHDVKSLGRRFRAGEIVPGDEVDPGCLQSLVSNGHLRPHVEAERPPAAEPMIDSPPEPEEKAPEPATSDMPSAVSPKRRKRQSPKHCGPRRICRPV